MDIQSPPEYYMKFFDDMQTKSISPVLNNGTSDVNPQLTYLISLEQEDGTSQVVQITEEEAKVLGIFSNSTIENSNITSYEVVKKNLQDPLELTNTNPAIKPIKHANKAITRRKKVLATKKAINIHNDNKERETEVNLIPYSPSLLHTNDTTHLVQLTEEQVRELGIFSNSDVKTPPMVNNNAIQKTIENSSNCIVKQSAVKSKNKHVVRKKSVGIKKINREQKHESNVLSYSTILQTNGSSQVVQLIEEGTKVLGIFPNDIVINCPNVTNTVNSSENGLIQSTDIVKTKPHVKLANKTGVHRKIKKVINTEKNVTASANVPNDNSKQASLEINLLPYSSALLQTDNTPQIVQLIKEEPAGLGIYVAPNQSTTSIEDTKTVSMNTVKDNNINQRLNNSNKVVFQQNNIRKVPSENSASETKTESAKPLGSCENPIEIIKDGEMLHSTQNLSQDYLQQIAKALQFDNVTEKSGEDGATDNKSPNIIYRVVYPEELDLNPKPTISIKPMKRGRPKKRSLSEDEPEEEEVKPIKNVRTRSGRITRPPKHIKQDFKKIDTSEVDNMESDLKTVEFEPLKTNQPPSATDSPKKLNLLENHQRKRSIAAQFRCPKCQKAYLGHSKMLKHLQKHPDHGPIPEHCKPRLNNDTWNFLIDLSNKNPSGQRGLKFCRELVNFLHNVRILAKVFFKRPTNLDKNMYYVDDTLSSVLGIESGNYTLNENELHKEINVLALIKDKSNHNNDVGTNEHHSEDIKTLNGTFDLDEFVKKCQTDNHTVEENINFANNEQCTVLNGDNNDDFKQNLNENSNTNPKSNCILDNIHFEETKINFDAISNSDHNTFNLNCDISSVQNFNEELHKFNEHMMNNFNERNINENCKSENSTTQVVEQNTHEQAASSELSLHNELLSENSLLNSLPNLRNSVELMLNNVDSAQVTNLLDNSTSSDEVMNVDQFVNERFKNLTESDLELPNTSLNLDLPSLDLFQFHTS